MRLRTGFVALTAALFLGGCVENTAPGNDREAELEPPAEPAEVASAASAMQGVGTHLLLLETITEPDLGNAPEVGGESCRFRYTRVGFPVVLYGASAVVKMNGKLVPLDRVGEGRYESAGVQVSVEPLEEPGAEGDLFQSRMIVRFPEASNELGFHGFSDC